MKKITIALCSIFLLLTSSAQETIPVHFDERADLMAVVWRLSGANEYNLCKIPQYAQEVDEVFAQFKNHPVVELARQYRQEYGVSYDAVASYALHLKLVENEEITFDEGFLKGSDKSFDRWSEEQKKEFLIPLTDFYRASDFHNWYMKQQDLYAKVESAFSVINKNVDYEWFSNYFGMGGNSDFRIVLSLLVGPHNYGCSAKLKNGKDKLSPVVGCCEIAENGDFYYDQDMVLPIVVHEFCHHFCNPLNDKNWSLMQQSAEKIYQVKADQLSKSAYNSALTMMNETFVRASVIHYMTSHYPHTSEEAFIRDEESNGFVLTRTLCEVLKNYEQQRGSYASMSDFMPVIAKAVNDFDLKQYIKEEKKSAKLNATYKVNIKNGAKNIPSGACTVVIKFSKPMVWGIAMNPSSSGAEMPEFKGYNWPDDKTLEVYFLLKPSTRYGFTVLGSYFQTKDDHNAGKDKEINFTTR